jgi:short-subunit dehydrogenase
VCVSDFRNKERGLEARDSIVEQTKNNNVELRILDISNTQSIVDFVHSYREEDLPAHVLVNNAGVMLSKLI